MFCKQLDKINLLKRPDYPEITLPALCLYVSFCQLIRQETRLLDIL